MPYVSTANKATIRQAWDYALLERWRNLRGHRLTYFGLPGPDIHDFLDWRDLLGDHKTAVESLGRSKRQQEAAAEVMGRLNMNVLIRSLSSGFQLLRADVEDVILNGVDADGNPPQLNDGLPTADMHFQYDFINLDFDGGFGYRDRGGTSKRVRAIKRLFQRQQGHPFIFFLTINVRHTLGDELDVYLEGLQSRDRGAGWRETVQWYRDRGEGEVEYKLKAAIPSLIQAVAEPCMFHCTCRPPISYVGHERARMMHFVFELECRPGNLRVFSAQDDRDLIDLALLRCLEGHFEVPRQHPGFDVQKFHEQLEFLPSQVREEIHRRLVAAESH